MNAKCWQVWRKPTKEKMAVICVKKLVDCRLVSSQEHPFVMTDKNLIGSD
jgi:hypothetical protein